MFNKNKRITQLEEKINYLQTENQRMQDYLLFQYKMFSERIANLERESGKYYAWKTQKEEVELMQDGKKYKEILTIIKKDFKNK